LPLGAILARRDFSSKQLETFSETLRDSLLYARKNPEESAAFILEKSQEKQRDVIEKHIELYVTKETIGLSSLGLQAIETFLKLGEQLGYYETSSLCHFK
jgi:1,4-dihydroxy-6-naphthoate synthase